MKVKLFRLISTLFSSLALILPSSTLLYPASAVAEEATSASASSSLSCRVLFPALPGDGGLESYFSYEDGKPGGYYGDLLGHLSDLGSVNMEYVIPSSTDEWVTMLSSMMEGTNTYNLDLLVNCSLTGLKKSYPDYENVISMSTRTDLKHPIYLLTQESNSTLSEFDLDTYVGAKVGLLSSSSSRNDPFYSWAKNSGLYFGENDARNLLTVTVFDTAGARDEAFKSLSVDIIIDDIEENGPEIETRTLASVGSIDSYMGVRKDNLTLYRAINSSLSKTHDDGGDYLTTLSEKYFPTHYDKIVLNSSEVSYVQRVSSFSIAYEVDIFPFIYESEGTLKGFLPAYLGFFSSYIEENYGTSFKVSFVKDGSYGASMKKKVYDGDVDIWWGRNPIHDEDEDYSLLDTDSYIETQVNFVGSSSSFKPLEQYQTIGVALEQLFSFSQKGTMGKSFVHYDDPTEMLRAVNDGKLEAGLTFFPFYKYAKEHLRFDNLIDLEKGSSSSLCFSTSSNNPSLHSLLNKLVHYMNATEKADDIYESSYDDYSYTVLPTDFFQNNFILIASISLGLFFVLILTSIVLFILFRSKKKRTKELKRLSETDTMVGIFNKQYMIDQSESLISSLTPFSFYIIDINDFKCINDCYGHLQGDIVLKTMAHRFAKISDMLGATLGRFGGDEFAFLFPETDEASMATFSKLVLAASEDKVLLSGNNSIKVDLSLGAAAFPTNAKDVDGLINAADDALYSVKDKRIGGYNLFDPSLDYSRTRRSIIKSRLEKAISEGRIYMVYQPIVNIQTMKAEGFEALMRVKDEEGELSPSLFIPVAESTGLIKELGEIAIKKCFAFGDRLKNEGVKATLAVNISAVQAEDPTLNDNIAKWLSSWPSLSFSDFVFELTERVFFQNPLSEKEIKVIKSSQISLSLDDFGTGYSSLTSLSRFPYKYIKFDKSLIDEIGSERTLDKLFEYVHGFGYMIVAEGAEKKAQIDYLQKVGCEYVQGFYFSKPLGEDEAIEYFRKTNETPVATH